MQKTTEYSDQALRQLFSKLPKEDLSSDFQLEIMERVRCEKARRHSLNQWLIWSSLGTVSCVMLAMMWSVFQYFNINLLDYFREFFILPQIEFSNWIPYLFVGSSTLLLLFIDNQLRKLFHKGY